MLMLAFAGLSTAAIAQEATEIPTQKYSVATNKFGGNWFVSVGGDYTAYYSSQEYGLGLSTNPFKDFRRAWGADIAVGKWFTPGLGLRLKGQGIWGAQVNSEENAPEFKQWNLSAQALFNLNNLFCGYKERVWNISPYVGFGFTRNCSDNYYSMLYSVGLLNQFNITKRFHINLDIYAQMGESDLDGVSGGGGNRTSLKTRDRQVGASIGLGVNLGKVGWSKTPDVEAIMALNKSQMDALNASLADQQSENARLKALLAKQPKEKIVEKIVKVGASNSASVFFNLNSSRIASKKDLVNVKEIVDYAKANNAKVVVTGYADSKTGSAAYNKQLSEKRANTVADKLVEMGLSRDQLIVEGKGGVEDLTPMSYNRRVTVKLQ